MKAKRSNTQKVVFLTVVFSLLSAAHARTNPEQAAQIRELLNLRIAEWTGSRLQSLSCTDMLAWRGMIVDQRINLGIAPWKEANNY